MFSGSCSCNSEVPFCTFIQYVRSCTMYVQSFPTLRFKIKITCTYNYIDTYITCFCRWQNEICELHTRLSPSRPHASSRHKWVVDYFSATSGWLIDQLRRVQLLCRYRVHCMTTSRGQRWELNMCVVMSMCSYVYVSMRLFSDCLERVISSE